MTRVYGFRFTCDVCRRPGPWGWVYRCTQDRDDMIEHSAKQGYSVRLTFSEEEASSTLPGASLLTLTLG